MRVSYAAVDRIIQEQGWDPSTLARLFMTFIEEKELEPALADFLEIRAADENGDNGEE